MSRTTIEPKEKILHVRLEEDIKSWVEKKAYREDRSLSEVVRELIREAMRDNRI